MVYLRTCCLVVAVMLTQRVAAQGEHSDHNMTLDNTGMVMNGNAETLPRDCERISRDYQFTIYASTEYAEQVAGTTFGMSDHELQVEPCSRITVTFINNDSVRHQWMVHGLPRYLYPAGMFHLESAGGQQQTGTFIVPSDDQTYLVHCDMAQHMEKGMKAQLKVGRGSGDLWAVPTVSGNFKNDHYLPRNIGYWVALSGLIGMVLAGWLLQRAAARRRADQSID